jgi:hypothetical protein
MCIEASFVTASPENRSQDTHGLSIDHAKALSDLIGMLGSICVLLAELPEKLRWWKMVYMVY